MNKVCIPLLGLLLAIAASATIKVALPQAPQVKEKPDTEIQRLQIILSLYLHDRLEGMPDVWLADDEWVGAVLDEIRGSKRRPQPETFFQSFTACLPVDAVVDLTFSETECTCTVFTHEGAKPLTVPLGPAKRLAATIGPFVAQALKLSPEAAKRLQIAGGDDPLFDADYLARRLHGVWIDNTGEIRLRALDACLPHLGEDPAAVRAVLEAGPFLSTDGRKVDNMDINVYKVRLAVAQALGTPMEPLAMAFLRINKQDIPGVEEDQINHVKLLVEGDLGAVLKGTGGLDDKGDLEDMQDPFIGLLTSPGTVEQRAGAVRALGVLHSAKGLPWVRKAAKHEDARVRRAAAFALAQYDDAAVRITLTTLAKDADPAVAFEARAGLWNAGAGSGPPRDDAQMLLTGARGILKSEPGNLTAIDVLAKLGVAADIPALKSAVQSSDFAMRAAAANGLFRLGAVDNAQLAALLTDCAPPVVMLALGKLPLNEAETRQRLVAFANNPLLPLADTARLRAVALLPKEEPARSLFALQIEHSYVRREIVESLAKNQAPWAVEALAQAATNPQPHVRALALAVLTERALDRAAPLIKAALSDPYYWTRFRAATLAPKVAKQIGVEALRQALAAEEDLAARLYLADAVTLAEGKPLPAPQPAANPMDPHRNYSLLCGYGAGVASSPYEAYYCGDAEITDAAKQASAAGKVFLCRVETVSCPSQALLDPNWDDRYWQAVRDGLTNWRWIDGVIFGEETMGTGVNNPNTWRYGWWAFCRDAGIDPQRVDGDRSKLTPAEQRAWENWEQRLSVEGFNELYDFVKLYFGKLRPGFMVGTFLPDQDTLKPQEKTWKFDVGGAYYYGTSNRERYAMIRRFRTVWPDRPVVWLSRGFGAINTDEIRYNVKVAEQPILQRNTLAYADSVCAWLAGGETGQFVSYLLMDRKTPGGDHAGGDWVNLESIAGDRNDLDVGIEHAFTGILDFYKSESVEMPTEPGNEGEFDLTFDDRAEKEKQLKARVTAEKERMRLGFFLEQQYLYNCARIFYGMPWPEEKPAALWVSANRRFDQLDWCNAYDMQFQLNELPSMDLSRYRFIGIAGMDAAPVQDATIASLTRWLKEQPGLLYIRGTLSADNANEDGTPEDHDGKLLNDWPWEKDVMAREKSYQIGGAAQVLLGTPDAPVLVYWKGDGFRGGLIFDLSDGAGVQERINKLIQQEKIGCPLDGIPGVKVLHIGQFTGAVATAGDTEPLTLPGVDLLTGEPDPVVIKGRCAALVAEHYQGRYVAAMNGVAVLGEAPLEGVEAVNDGIKAACKGWIRAGAATGKVRVTTVSGRVLKTIPVENMVQWLLFGVEDGIATLPVGEKGATVTYIRCNEAVTMLAQK